MSLHACNVWQRYTFFFVCKKMATVFLVTIFLACCLTNCALVVYAVFFLLVVARPVFVNSVPSMLFGE